MKSYNLMFSIVFLVISSLVPSVSADTIQVILQGGQSNAVGNAPTSGLPTELQSFQTDIMFYFGRSATQNSSFHSNYSEQWIDLQPGSGYTVGPEILFGRTISDALSSLSNQFAIIKYGHGGTGFVDDDFDSINGTWHAGGDATTAGDGKVYLKFQATVSAALSSLEAAHPNKDIQIVGMIWAQGEKDGAEPDDYHDDLTAFFADIRATYGENLPIVLSQLSDNQISMDPTGLAAIKAAQATIAAADSNIEMVITDDCTVKSDNIHFDASAMIKIGTRMAEKMITLLPSSPYLLRIDTIEPASNVIVSSTPFGSYTRCFDPDQNANHNRGQSFTMPSTGGPLATQWAVDAITIKKSENQTFATDSQMKLWVFEWNPNKDGNDYSTWNLGDGDQDSELFDGTGVSNVLIDGEMACVGANSISSGTYVTFDFNEPLMMDENKAYAFVMQYYMGAASAAYFQIAIGSGYVDGQLIQVTSTVNKGVTSQDVTFYVQGKAVSNCVNPPLADISGPVGQQDCIVDISDFAVLAAEWLNCGLEPVMLCL